MGNDWTFLSSHALVLLAITADPAATQREIAARVAVTEKTVQKIVKDLIDEGYVTRFREGRRNRYELNPDAPFRHSLIGRDTQVRALTGLLSVADQDVTPGK